MVRAPCCEKMGLKRGPWTPEEDHVLVSYITKHGHGNWRALPRLAGLSRCGKSCRLRWINYLRPDIKRGNFTSEEEETIINLHQMLGNRWSAIAAQLPGRTDNEIKNVWHTHLKKRVNSGSTTPQSTKRKSKKISTHEMKSDLKSIDNDSKPEVHTLYSNYTNSTSLVQSGSEFSSSCTDSPTFTRDNNDVATEGGESGNGLPELPELDESFWSEALSMENPNAPMDGIETMPSINSYDRAFLPIATNEDDMDFWLGVLLDSGDLKDQLPTF